MASFYIWNSSRQNLFWPRYYSYMSLFRHHFNLPADYSKPGLEIKFALEEAEKIGAKTYFLGAMYDQVTWHRLFHETRTTVLNYFFKRLQYFNSTLWASERAEVIARQDNSSLSQYTEQCLDPHSINWYI